MNFDNDNTGFAFDFNLSTLSFDDKGNPYDLRYKDDYLSGLNASIWLPYDLISVGNRIKLCDDDFSVTTPNSLFFGFSLIIKNDSDTSGESITLSNSTGWSKTISIADLNPSKTSDFLFWGVSSDVGFDTITFEENYLDNIGINQLSFSTAAAIPEPSTYALILGFCSVGFMIYRRRKS